MDPQQIPLRDLHLPEMVGLWPLAPGWWLLIAAAVGLALYLLRMAVRKWRYNAARRLALRELGRVRDGYARGVDMVTLTKQLSELLRRSMLAYAPRASVAGLTGDQWLEWLDHGLDERLFSDGPGRILVSLPYQQVDEEESNVDIDQLISVVRRRLQTPLTEAEF